MSSEAPAVVITDLKKRYQVDAAAATSLGEAIVNRLKGRSSRSRKTDFYALDGVSLTVQRGEVLGIVGHNGAGKSTLLKVLSRITEPSAGRVQVTGRVGALLEVGTGFHPELTGRENIFLNGSILGMSRTEVAGRFDDIVAFSGVEKFLDVPVKRYSSGMSVRLAFAVASSLEADVLIVDEVLAVGDVEFQRKCMGRMSEVASTGRTVLFVSHNLAAVQALCTRAVLLKRGKLVEDGHPDAIVAAYLAGLQSSGTLESPGTVDLAARPGEAPRPHLRRMVLRREDSGQPTDVVHTGGRLVVDIQLTGADALALPHVGLSLWTDTGTVVATTHTQMAPAVAGGLVGNDRTYRLVVDPLPVLPGQYWLDVGVRNGGDPEYLDMASRAVELTVLPGDVYGSGVLPASWEGLIYLQGGWSVS